MCVAALLKLLVRTVAAPGWLAVIKEGDDAAQVQELNL